MGRRDLNTPGSPKERLYRLERPREGERPLAGVSLLDRMISESKADDRRNRLAFFYFLLERSHRIDDPALPQETVEEAHQAYLRWAPYDEPLSSDRIVQLLAELNRQKVTALDVWIEFGNGLPFPKFEKEQTTSQPSPQPKISGTTVSVELSG
jgi:hypothetical protein